MTLESFKERITIQKLTALGKHIAPRLAPSLKWILIVSLSVFIGAVISLPFTTWYMNHNLENRNPSSSNEVGGDAVSKDCNAIGINLHGFLTTYEEEDLGDSYGSGDISTSDDIVQKIEYADKTENMLGTIIEVDSSGGLPIAGEEIATAISNSKKPVVAFIRSTGASSAYWAISNAKRIFASKNSDVGSIGITLSYLSNVEKNKKDGYKYEQINSGKYKDLGSPDKPLTDDERAILQRTVNIMSDNFVSVIAENRKIPLDKVKAFADGKSVLGEEAKSLGLIDEIGGLKEAEKYLGDLVGEKVEVCW